MNRWNYQWSQFKNEDKDIFLDWIYPTKLHGYKGKVVLDAGCGNGGYTKIVAEFAKKVVALDKYSSASAKLNLKECKNVKVISGDIETFASKEKFDAVFCVGVLHHLNNPQKGFNNLLRNLKSGGFINVWVYAKEGNWFMIHILEPLKNKILLKIPLFFMRLLAFFLTFILYVPAWLIFLLPFNFSYFQYFQKFRHHSFERNLMNVFDKLNAEQTIWVEEEQIREWFKGLDKVVIRHYNHISWSGFGIKK